MPKYYGCPCEGCGKPLTLQDDIVVCPDCGAPYHRTCYEKMGLCIHAPAHGAGYEWKFPYQDAQLRTCPACGERTLRSESVCRCCGAALPPESAEQPNDRAAASAEQNRDFDYSGMYRDEMYRSFTEKVIDPVHRNVRAAFGKDELIDGVPYQDWVDYIGTAAPVYLNDYSQMQLRHSKISMSFSALLFGPFYFFYRKAWKPAFGFLAAELLLFVPTLISMMQTTGSPLTARHQCFRTGGAEPHHVFPQLCTDAGAGAVRQMVLPPQRCGTHPPHPCRVPGSGAAPRCAERTGRCQHCSLHWRVHPADDRRQPLLHAAGAGPERTGRHLYLTMVHAGWGSC